VHNRTGGDITTLATETTRRYAADLTSEQ
jgi:hypothetical protein